MTNSQIYQWHSCIFSKQQANPALCTSSPTSAYGLPRFWQVLMIGCHPSYCTHSEIVCTTRCCFITIQSMAGRASHSHAHVPLFDLPICSLPTALLLSHFPNFPPDCMLCFFSGLRQYHKLQNEQPHEQPRQLPSATSRPGTALQSQSLRT